MIIQIYEERASLYRARFLLFIKHITLILMLCLLPAQANASSLWDQITRFLPFAQDKSETQLSSPEAKQTNKSHSNADGNFDFYVLALSWTPTQIANNVAAGPLALPFMDYGRSLTKAIRNIVNRHSPMYHEILYLNYQQLCHPPDLLAINGENTGVAAVCPRLTILQH